MGKIALWVLNTPNGFLAINPAQIYRETASQAIVLVITGCHDGTSRREDRSRMLGSMASSATRFKIRLSSNTHGRTHRQKRRKLGATMT